MAPDAAEAAGRRSHDGVAVCVLLEEVQGGAGGSAQRRRDRGQSGSRSLQPPASGSGPVLVASAAAGREALRRPIGGAEERTADRSRGSLRATMSAAIARGRDRRGLQSEARSMKTTVCTMLVGVLALSCAREGGAPPAASSTPVSAASVSAATGATTNTAATANTTAAASTTTTADLAVGSPP